jgi:hypothetical protein
VNDAPQSILPCDPEYSVIGSPDIETLQVKGVTEIYFDTVCKVVCYWGQSTFG